MVMWRRVHKSGDCSPGLWRFSYASGSQLNWVMPVRPSWGQKRSNPGGSPTDQTTIPVTDNGGSLTVDGTVAATKRHLEYQQHQRDHKPSDSRRCDCSKPDHMTTSLQLIDNLVLNQTSTTSGQPGRTGHGRNFSCPVDTQTGNLTHSLLR